MNNLNIENKRLLMLAFAAALCALSLPAQAGLVTFNDQSTNLIGYSDTTGRASSNNCLLGGLALGDTCTVTVTAPIGTASLAGGPSPVNIFDNDNPLILSDTMEWSAFSLQSITVTFRSDAAASLLPGGFSMIENGMVQIASGISWFGSTGQLLVRDDFAFISEAHGIPEPSVLAMVGFGLVGLGLRRCRLSRPAVQARPLIQKGLGHRQNPRA